MELQSITIPQRSIGSVFVARNLENVLDFCVLTDCNFINCTFTKEIIWTLLTRCTFENCEFLGEEYENVQFIDCVLRDCSFTGQAIHGLRFNTCELYKVTIENLEVASVSIAGCRNAQITFREVDDVYLEVKDCKSLHLSSLNILFSEIGVHGSDLSGSEFLSCDLMQGSFTNSKFVLTDFIGTSFNRLKLKDCNFTSSDFTRTQFINTSFESCDLSGSYVFGSAAWRCSFVDTLQQDLKANAPDEPTVLVDSLSLAQFVSSLLHNDEFRNFIDTLKSKVVLLLGSFASPHKERLNSLRIAMREAGYIPVIFDFDAPSGRSVYATVSTLGYLSRFIVADITNPRVVHGEIEKLANLRVPMMLIMGSDQPMPQTVSETIALTPTIAGVFRYQSDKSLIEGLKENVIAPAELTVSSLESSLLLARQSMNLMNSKI